MSSKKTKLKDHKKSTNYSHVDLLDEDAPIAGQKFVCLSFISPEDIIKNKELFYFENFLKRFEFKKSLEKYNQFLNFLSYKYKIDFNKLTKDLDEFVEEEKDNLFQTTIEDEYKTFIDQKEDELQKEYNQICEFQTNTRGIKVRGVFASQEEAELKCKTLRANDENHDVYVGQVGLWMPFHPEAYRTGKVEYLEKELNELMAQKKHNDEVSKEEFKNRVKESKKKAIQDNIEKANKEGNKLLQTIDEEGNLINSDRLDVPGKNLLFGDNENNDVVTANLKKELFEDPNVIIGKKSDNDHGLNEIINLHKKLEETQEENQEETQEETQQETQEETQEELVNKDESETINSND